MTEQRNLPQRLIQLPSLLVKLLILGRPVLEIHDPLRIEHMAAVKIPLAMAPDRSTHGSQKQRKYDIKTNRALYSRRRPLIPLLLILELHKRGKKQYHIAALVHDGRSTVSAADLTRQLVPRRFLRRVVPD